MTSAPRQRPLFTPLPADVALVSLRTAASLRGVHIDAATELLDGEWPWAFDLSAGRGEVREVRVWRGCLQAVPSPGAEAQSLVEVIADVIGTQAGDVRGVTLETRWDVSDLTLKRLLTAGEISGQRRGHTLWIARASLAAFLERRLIR